MFYYQNMKALQYRERRHMTSTVEKETYERLDETNDIVKDITKLDHLLLIGVGIVPILVASIWYILTN